MEPDKRTAIIVGAGIGGLAAAIALRQAGYATQVYERARDLQEVGAGLTLWPNALSALRKLGLGAFLDSQSFPAIAGAIYTSRGRTLAKMTPRELARVGGSPAAVHRAELQAALLRTLESFVPGEQVVWFGAHALRYEQDAQQVTLDFADGRQASGAALIGADGLHSVIRQQLFGPEPPRYAGFTAWRSVIPTPAGAPLLAGEFWGRGHAVGVVPLGRERVYWFATRNAPEGEESSPRERKQEALSLFQNWHRSIPALIQATPEDDLHRNDIYDRPPLSAWGEGRVTMLGDAAHPMTPNLGQGACQALEDAIVLGACLWEATSISQALQAYQTLRMPLVNMVASRSRQLGALVQRESLLGAGARNLVVKLVPASVRLKQLAPIFTYDV